WLRLAGEQGHPKAAGALGYAYVTGNGVDADYGEAAKWYLVAADHGFEDCQFNLGLMYFYGDGVEQDEIEALKWFVLSADADSAKAKDERMAARDDLQARLSETQMQEADRRLRAWHETRPFNWRY
ncbi:MAG: sel1 repeat family protein, partial [Rhodospirillaceae bacterium]|nr:sel1 repeat family protein [Rhodospirillaceae bacterium]